MATQKEIIEIEIKGTGAAQKSFEQLGDIIQEQRDITIEFEKELLKLQRQLKETPKGALSEQKSLKDRIERVKEALKGQSVALKDLNNQRKKASEVTKANIKDTLDNGGAVAILDQVTGGLATRVRDAFEATKLFNFSLKGTRTALIATGIGAFVIALGLVVVFWDDIRDAINGANAQLQKQIDLNNENITSLNTQLELLDLQKQTLEAQGESTAEIAKRQKELNELLIQTTEAQIISLRLQKEREGSASLELSTLEKLENLARRAAGLPPIVTRISEEELDRQKELTKTIEETEIALAKLRLSEAQADAEATLAGRGEITEATIGEQLERERLLAEGSLEIVKEFADKRLEAIQLLDSEELKSSLDLSIGKSRLIAKERQQDIELRKFKDRNRKQELAQDIALQRQRVSVISQTFGAISEILGTNSKAGKAAAIAQATINTYQGITEVWSSKSTLPEPFATIARIASTATVLASGLSAVRQIKSQKLPSLGGQGVANIASASAPPLPTTVQAASPSFSLAGATGVNQLAESIGGQTQQPLQAFVVSSEVTSAQRLDDNIIQASSIG